MKFPKNLASVEKLMFLIIAFIAFIALINVSTGCNCTDSYKDSGLKIGIANPAAVYCEELGYQYKIITGNEGGQKGICVFPDKSECDAWNFFTGKCRQKYTYCRKHGYDIETVRDRKSPFSQECAVCVLPDRTKTPVTELMELDKRIFKGSIKNESEMNVSEIAEESELNLPSTFDWRNKEGGNWLTPVKDQGGCGSCWAFSAVGTVEPQYNIFYDNPDFDPDLSEQYLVSDCCADCGDCGGGWPATALEFTRYEGISDEACFPYIASNCPCSDRCSDWSSRLWKINYTAGPLPDDIETIKKYLIEKGPLSVCLGMNGYFDDGIYRCDDDTGINHAVVIVGYNDTGNYWMVKNSWGEGWNEEGYFNVGYKECGIENYIYYASLEKNLSYCPASTNNADYEWIKRVELNDKEKNSGSSTYSNFTDEVLTTLKRGDTYTLYVDAHTTSSYLEFVKVWIDFNDNKDFIDLGEEIDLGNYTFEGNHTFSANFKVPGDAVLSETRLRVYLKYDGEPDPCENASYGEIEDYTVKIISPAVLTDNYSDYGIDTDVDSYYDYLAIDVGVNVTEPGYYGISGRLYDELGNYVDYESNYTYLDSGNQSVTLKFDGMEIRRNGVSGTFNLKRLYLKDENYNEVDYRYYAYTTFYYNYTDFEPLPAMFASGFHDCGEDTDGDLLYDYLVIEKEVNVSEAGNYEVYGSLYSPSGDYVDSDSNYTTLSAGLQNVTLKFQGWDIYKTRENGNFDVFMHLYYYPPESAAQATTTPQKIAIDSQHIPIQKNFEEREIASDIYEERLENKTLEETGLGSSWLDTMENTTSYYSYTEFEPPPAEFNDQYSDYGEDTDGDGLNNYLVIDVGVDVREAGSYRARGYLYDNTGHQIDYESNTTYLSAGNQIVQLKFEGIKIRQNEVNGTFDLKSLYLYDSSTGDQLDYRYYAYTTRYYNWTEFQIPPAKFNDVYSDYGEDTDGDGLYDYLAIDVGVNVTEPGYYWIGGDLFDEVGSYVDSAWNSTHLDSGNHSVTLKFSGIDIRKNGVNGTFNLKHLSIRDDSYDELDYRYDAYTTYYYNYTDFEPLPALFASGFNDYGEDTNSNALYDYLVIEKEINVLKAGDYRVSGWLYAPNGTSVDYDSNYTTLSAGLHNVTLKFRGWDIYKTGENGNFDVSMYLYYYPPESAAQATTVPEKITVDSQYIPIQESIEEKEIAFEIYEEGLENKTLEETGLSSSLLDWMENTTSYYSHTEFESPPAEFNDQNSDFGEDTDGDGLYNYLVVGVGVNVTEAGDYRARGYLYDNQGHQIDYESNTTYLSAGNQTLQLKFEGIKIRQNEVNGTFDLSLYLYDSLTGDTLDYRYYTTSYYNYTDFQIPPAEFNDVYGDYGEDTDGDGLYDYLVVDVGVNVIEAGDYRVSGELYENGTYNFIDYDSNTTYLNEGSQTVQLRFEGIKIRNNEYNGTYDLKYLVLYNTTSPAPVPTPTPPPAVPHESESKATESIPAGYGEQLDYRYYAYTTFYYNYTEFQIPPAKFNDDYDDHGEDTDGDGLYDYLVVDVGVNVTEAGDYRVSGSLYENETYNYVDYDGNTTYLNEGNQTVQLRFDAWKITKSGTFDLKYLRLYNATYPYPTPTPVPTATPTPAVPRESESRATDSIPVGYGEQLDYRYYAYTTGYYEPLPRPALLNDVYSDDGEDTNDPQDGLYNYLVVEVGVNVTEVGNYRISGELYETGTYNFVDSTSNTVYLNHLGNQTVPLRFEGIKIRNNEHNGTYDLKYLSLYDANYPVPTPTPTPAVPRESKSKPTEGIPVGYGEQLDYRYYAYTTSYYNYTEFEESIPDAYEPDDNPLLANYISVDGTKQTHDFHIPGDHDWLKFNATKGNSYTIETSELEDESDTYLYLYDTDGTTEIDHDDDSGIGLASKIAWNCSISGTYYVMMRHFSSSAFGPETRYNISVTVKEAIFDTGSSSNPYPSIMGNHTGTIKLNHTVIATRLYTYPCIGTGGHTEYAEIRNATWNATATWEGYVGDWKNISFDKTVVLLANKTYNYTIRTGSYPQIHHTPELPTANGWINCTKFTDANGKTYTNWIPAIRLW